MQAGAGLFATLAIVRGASMRRSFRPSRNSGPRYSAKQEHREATLQRKLVPG